MAPKSRRSGGSKIARKVAVTQDTQDGVFTPPADTNDTQAVALAVPLPPSEPASRQPSPSPRKASGSPPKGKKSQPGKRDVSQQLQNMYQHDPRYDDIRPDYDNLLIKSESDDSIFAQQEVADTEPIQDVPQPQPQEPELAEEVDHQQQQQEEQEPEMPQAQQQQQAELIDLGSTNSLLNSITSEMDRLADIAAQEKEQQEEEEKARQLQLQEQQRQQQKLEQQRQQQQQQKQKQQQQLQEEQQQIEQQQEEAVDEDASDKGARRAAKYEHIGAKVKTNLSPKRTRKASATVPEPVAPAPQLPYETLRDPVGSFADILKQINVAEAPAQTPAVEESAPVPEVKPKVVTRWEQDSPIRQYLEQEVERSVSPVQARPGSPNRRRWQVPEKQQGKVEEVEQPAKPQTLERPMAQELSGDKPKLSRAPSTVSEAPSQSINRPRMSSVSGSPTAARRATMQAAAASALEAPVVHTGSMATDLASFYNSLRGSGAASTPLPAQDAHPTTLHAPKTPVTARRKSSVAKSGAAPPVMAEGDLIPALPSVTRDVQREPYFALGLQGSPESSRRASSNHANVQSANPASPGLKKRQLSLSMPSSAQQQQQQQQQQHPDSGVTMSPGYAKAMAASQSQPSATLRGSAKSSASQADIDSVLKSPLTENAAQQQTTSSAGLLTRILSHDLVWQLSILFFLVATFHILTVDLSTSTGPSVSSLFGHFAAPKYAGGQYHQQQQQYYQARQAV
ncbi:hypothetical protein RI367_001411 [Sorochytrium milnesiophthora]